LSEGLFSIPELGQQISLIPQLIDLCQTQRNNILQKEFLTKMMKWQETMMSSFDPADHQKVQVEQQSMLEELNKFENKDKANVQMYKLHLIVSLPMSDDQEPIQDQAQHYVNNAQTIENTLQ
jgi:hypothetical protein